MSEYVGIRIDRNFLLLLAIYAIHCFLLHVFVQPINLTSSITINKNFLSKINDTNFNENIEINRNYYQNEKNNNDSQTVIVDDDIVITHHQVRHIERLPFFFYNYLLIVCLCQSIDFLH